MASSGAMEILLQSLYKVWLTEELGYILVLESFDVLIAHGNHNDVIN